ncbi:hypothetical protein BGZ72_003794 [Mortierella alpina]|nr:hypothetical protein BGZ72_003794 [Mortierella alpina]
MRPSRIDVRSQVYDSRPSKTAAAINIPSPPLTPYLGHGDDEDVDDKYAIYPSQYYSSDERTKEKRESSLSASTPSTISPRQRQRSASMSSVVPSLGFTFSTNLSASRPKEDQESYASFLKKMEEDYWKSVSTIRSTYFFDGIGRGGGFLAIPHLASHGNAKTNVICRLLESWLTKKLVEPTISEESIPVLEDNIQSSVESIERHLLADPRVWSGISKAFIHIRCGHVFMLDSCCDDETIVHLGADEFYQDYPLFVDVEIKMHGESTVQHHRQQQQQGRKDKNEPTEVLIAFQNVVNRSDSGSSLRECSTPYVHRAMIRDGATATPASTAA